MNLSQHFTREEFEFSQTAARMGIDNIIPPELMENAKRTAHTMELVRSVLGNRPIRISSGYRAPELNSVIRGSAGSAHMQAMACDFTCPSYGTVYQTVETLAAILDDYDQLIYEGKWIHIGLSEGHPRREILTATFPKGKVHYQKGLHNT
jgi:zinc D-Ala-D-Ala carboxypeptidase